MALEVKSPVTGTASSTGRRRERGAALLETALIIPLLTLVAAGIFEFGHAYQQRQIITNAAREGARISVLPNADPDNVRAVVREYMRIGGLKHWSSAPVDVVRDVPLGGAATASQITISYPLEFIVLQPIVRLAGGGDGPPNITMLGSAVMRNESP
jgi:hypothetical protein